MSELSSHRRARLGHAAGRQARAKRPRRLATAADWALKPVDVGSEAEFQLALLLVRSRARRGAIIGADLFSDPAWEILLDLYVHARTGLTVPISSLCTGSTIPRTTLLRWVRTLADRGLVERRADSDDGRRVFVILTAEGRRRMDLYLREAIDSVPQGRSGR